jgi:RsiW-degrading membrane proteinase PrsW (M82 family)
VSLDAIPSIVFTIAISIFFPIIYLSIIRWLDLYASGSFKTVVACVGWGMGSTLIAAIVNRIFLLFADETLVVRFTAPIAEEILKSLVLIYLVRRPNFTYFVDGAVFGFASGTGFTILENLEYLVRSGPGQTLPVALTRAFTTSLLHGSATAMSGVALGSLKFSRGFKRALAPVLGWIGAVGLHMTFNNIVSRNTELGAITALLSLAVALFGFALVAGIIFVGLRQERRWMLEKLKMDVGVSVGESKVVQEMANFDTLLEPIDHHFGGEKRKQVEEFLRLQAQLGIKRKAQDRALDPVERAEFGTEVIALQEEMDALRRKVGVYCMTYVRSILPPTSEQMWLRLGQTIAKQKPSGDKSLWASLEKKIE